MLRGVPLLFLLLVPAWQCFARIPLEEQLDRPFASLLDSSDSTYPRKEFKRVRSLLEHERDLQIDSCRNEARQFRRQLDAARRELRTLNESASLDTPAAAARRRELHVNVAALERVIGDKQEREQT